MRRRVVLVGVWLGGTLFAMVLATLAVQLASAKVTDHPTAVISRPQLEAELNAARSSSTVVPTSSTVVPTPSVEDTLPVPDELPVDGANGGPGATTVLPAVTAPTTRPTAGPGPGPTTPDDHAGPGGDDPGGGGPGPSSPPSTTPATSEQQFSLVGGWVRVRCEGQVAGLVGSSPNPGFDMEVKEAGPQSVEVHFTSNEHESRFKARCQNGAVAVDEQRESDG